VLFLRLRVRKGRKKTKSTIPVPQRPSTFHPLAQRNAFRRRDARQQSRLFVPENRRLRPSPRKDKRGADLICDALPFGGLWYGGSNAISNAIGYAQFIVLSWFGTPRVLAIPPSPRLRRAQAKEEEAETL
jgi:hypothetical protein